MISSQTAVWLVMASSSSQPKLCQPMCNCQPPNKRPNCASPTCRDAFLDESRNRSRRYCDSRTCGNRLHVAAYRARKAAAG